MEVEFTTITIDARRLIYQLAERCGCEVCAYIRAEIKRQRAAAEQSAPPAGEASGS